MNQNELMHYGIQGMKWGVRRYQNPDGTLTKSGKKRYTRDFNKLRDKANADIQKNGWLDSYNRMADKMNGGLIEQFNKLNDPKSESAIGKYDDLTNKVFEIEANKRIIEKYNISELKSFLDKYGESNINDPDVKKNISDFYENIKEIESRVLDEISELEKVGYKY